MESNPAKVSLPLRRAWQLHLRAWRIWWKLSPGFFLSTLASSATEALSPYLTLYLSARLIGELAGGRDPQALLFWVLALLVSSAALALLRGICKRWANCQRDAVYRLDDKIYMQKFFQLDYADLDRQAVYDL